MDLPFDDHVAVFLSTLAQMDVHALISGTDAKARTDVLRHIGTHVSEDELITICEYVPQLGIQRRYGTALSVTAESDMSDLMKMAARTGTRMLVDYLGGQEAWHFVSDVNTSYYGSFAAITAETPMQAMEELVRQVTDGRDIKPDIVRRILGSARGVVIQVGPGTDGKTIVTDIAEWRMDRDDALALSPLLVLTDGRARFTGMPAFLDKIPEWGTAQAAAAQMRALFA